MTSGCDEMWYDAVGCDVWADGIHLCEESGEHKHHRCACKATTEEVAT